MAAFSVQGHAAARGEVHVFGKGKAIGVGEANELQVAERPEGPDRAREGLHREKPFGKLELEPDPKGAPVGRQPSTVDDDATRRHLDAPTGRLLATPAGGHPKVGPCSQAETMSHSASM